MKKFKVTLFTRLYLSISCALLISAFLTFTIIDSYLYEEEVSDFAEDIEYIYNYFDNSSELNSIPINQPIILPKFFRNRFSAFVIENPNKEFLCTDCMELSRSIGKAYYEKENGVRFAVIDLNLRNRSLIITENLEALIEDEAERNMEEVAFPLLIFLCFITIASLLYWPVRKLQSNIKALVGCFEGFAKGDHKLRAKTNIPKPLDEIARSFNEMAESIDKNIEEKTVFAQAIPHEIRTPLSRIQLASGLIQKNSGQSDVTAWASNIDDYIDEINMFITQIMELTKLNNEIRNSSNLSYKTITLTHFIQARVSQLNAERLKEVIIDIDESIRVKNDPIYLTLLFDNLFQNALRYSNCKVAVIVKSQNGRITISVEDDGEGIPIKDMEKIFIPFKRLDRSRNRKTGGFGLGLAIANASANRMDSKLCVTQSSLGGAKFTFSLMN
ncbi:ATP-binding protein [Pseudoalteromonas sp. XMcav1-K]|uniref:ATP-binding protein n=1 Tax=Pseudoalteromonas sp. XMcav1-K TaxID=3374372 RepID=UPI0037563D33